MGEEISAKEKGGPPVKIPPQKPLLTKAERRALQEQQRAEKAARQQQPKKSNVSTATTSAKGIKKKNMKEEKKVEDGVSNDSTSGQTLQLFSHLPQYRDRLQEAHLSGVTLQNHDKNCKVELHPAALALGVNYANGSIRGANERCRAMMEAFKMAIKDYTPPISNTTIHLPTLLDQQVIKPSFQHWTSHCRAHSVTMGNGMNFLKVAIANLHRDETLDSAKQIICEQIDAYVAERITFAKQLVAQHGMRKIGNNDVILVYGHSEVILQMLLMEAKQQTSSSNNNKVFRVIVADARPLLEGKRTLRALVEHNIPCTYILLNAVSHVMMREVTKVFLGVAALMSDGSVLGRIGTASVALIAKSNHVPVLFCCESYKISSKVQLESFTGNELGDPNDVMFGTTNRWLQGWEEKPNLQLLNLVYDLTPSEFVSGIVTELGILPATSVAVLLREMNQSIANL